MTSWTLVTTNTTATSGVDYIIDTTSRPVYLGLPSTPSVGDQIMIADAGDFSNNNVTIVVGGSTIEGSNTNLTVSQKGIQLSLIYNGSTWKRYNIVVPQVKVSELSETTLSSVSNNDLMLFIDSETSESTKIKLSTMRSSIVGGYYSSSDVSTLVGDLNSYTQANTSPRLNTSLFDNRTASFYRNYNNLTNKPTIPVRTSQLINDGSVANGSPYISNLSLFNTDQLIEGSTNWYFTNSRFDTRLALKFPELFRLYSDNLDEEQVTDSVIAVAATPLTTVVASNTIIVSSSDVTKFASGQRIRLFGANIENTNITAVPIITNITKNGLAGSSNNVIAYKLAQFDRTSGKISPSSLSSTSVYIGDNTLDDFNTTNNIELEFSRGSGNYGILVYRSYNGSSYNLVDVLGPKELGTSTVEGITYKDFANFNNNSWTRKNSDGEYDVSTGIVHMPLTAPTSASKGWADATIVSVNNSTNRIVLSSEYYLSPNMSVCHNDTSTIQAAINERVAADVNSLTLNDRRYVVSSLVLPEQGRFTLSGKGRQTTLHKLPWADESHNKIIYTPGTTAQNVSITNMNIDGNMQNQVLKYDTGNDPDVNYAISLNGESINMDKVFVDNVVGGGLYSYQPSKLTVNLSRFENSGMSDFFAYSPMYAPEGDDVIITNNVFRNFSDSIDLNTTDNGVFSGNVVDNVGSGVYSVGFNVSAQSSNPRGVYFKPDGLKMYVVGFNSNVVEYTLSTAWSVSSAVYTTSFSISGQTTSSTGIFFAPDGTKMFISETVNDKIHQYTLSTPWSVSSAVYSTSYVVSSQDADPGAVFFSSDGTKMYIAEQQSIAVDQYDVGTPVISWSNNVVWENGTAPSIDIGTSMVRFTTFDGDRWVGQPLALDLRNA